MPDEKKTFIKYDTAVVEVLVNVERRDLVQPTQKQLEAYDKEKATNKDARKPEPFWRQHIAYKENGITVAREIMFGAQEPKHLEVGKPYRMLLGISAPKLYFKVLEVKPA